MTACIISSILALLMSLEITASIDVPATCPNLTFGSIPEDHLFHQKEKPIIIAHRGQPKVYQENTYDGILSAYDINADGFELDIYVTKDKKLVVFHDDNTMRMTGTSKIIWESTYEELKQLDIKTTITAGKNTYKFDKTRKIPLLEEVLNATKNTNLVHYLEMKPSYPNATFPNLAETTGQMVADMVTELGIINKTIIVSFDYHKVYAAKKRNSDITVGTLFTPNAIHTPKSVSVENWFKNFTQCAIDGPDDTFEFFQFVLQSGLLFKYSGSCSFDSDIKLYDNPTYSNNTLDILRTNYKPDISTGFYTVYSMSKTEEENLADEKKLKNLLAQGGGDRMITDDVPRLRKLIGRPTAGTSTIINGQSFIVLIFIALCISMLF